jgi:hypothetical protein
MIRSLPREPVVVGPAPYLHDNPALQAGNVFETISRFLTGTGRGFFTAQTVYVDRFRHG